MGWARFDDRRALNLKARAAGFEACGLDLAAICISAADETDGFVSENTVEMLCVAYGSKNKKRLTATLERVGRWHYDAEKQGWWIHDYLEYNPSKEQNEVEKARLHALRSAAGHTGGIKSGQTRRSKNEAKSKQVASGLLEANGEASCFVQNEAPTRPVVSYKSSVVTTAPRDPNPVENPDDGTIEEKAIQAIADIRLSRAGRANISNLPGYRRSVVASLRSELADRIATAPQFDTVEGLVAWLEPMSPAERQAAAQAKNLAINDAKAEAARALPTADPAAAAAALTAARQHLRPTGDNPCQTQTAS